MTVHDEVDEAFYSFFEPGSEHIDAALAYSALRIHVFPLTEGGKEPFWRSHAVHDATTNADQIKYWWREHPKANIGIGLRKSCIVIIDVDPRNGGDATLEKLEILFGKLPNTYVVQTARGGLHYYYRVSPDFYETLADDLPKKIGPGLELLVNGYAVAPPSSLTGERQYTVAKGTLEEPFAPAPLSWLQKVKIETAIEEDKQRFQDENWSFEVGERNIGMSRVAGLFRRYGFTAEEIYKMLICVGPNRFESFEEIEQREIWTTARSIAKHAPSGIRLDQVTLRIGARKTAPMLEPAALQGPIGEWVKAISPITEAHPAALMVQAVTVFGSLIAAKQRGDISPGFSVEGSIHRTGLFTLIIGDTSRAGKGDSWSRVWELMNSVDPTLWHLTGVQTGEGIIEYLADDMELDESSTINGEEVKHKKKGSRNDRRCLVYEPEFGRVLHVAERRGSVVKDILRDMWDKGETGKLTASSHQRVTEATLSLVGHITKAEIERDYDPTDFVNGFGNRFLYAHAERTQRLKLGKARRLTRAEVRSYTKPLIEALTFARESAPEEYEFTPQAEQYWDDQIDPELWRNHENETVDKLTDRGRPIVRRIATILAVADQEDCVYKRHLKAAFALWRYSVETCEYVFASLVGDKMAATIYRALLENRAGLNRTELYKGVFNSNKSSGQIDRALGTLLDRQLIFSRKDKAGKKTIEYFIAYPSE